ncbi:prominin-1-A isoform X1 [Octopus vulgaris]|uniref:Prominin-1-A isoform X1 n=1 Tax=Octopus vulgaris TaxID=6645 RepID=A0AA36BEL9_OCTVU|nr:prominin-1-A isoform X1 [Octopus vulgaris]
MDGLHRNNLFVKFFHVTFLLAVIIISLQITSIRAQSESNKTWGDFPDASTNLPPLEYSFEGLGAYFKFSRSFVYNSLKLDPLDLFEMFVGKNIKLDMEVVKKIILKNIGFVVAIAVGILFIIIFTLVGMCFCCCRNCNKCGGKRIQKNVNRTRRRIYVLLLLVTMILLSTGLACTLASISQMERNIKTVPKTITTSVDYVNDYIDKLFEQVDFIGSKTESLLMDEIEREMENIGTNVGGKLQTDIDTATHIREHFRSLRQFEKNMSTIQSIIHDVNSTVVSLESAVNTLNTSLLTLRTDIKNACGNCMNTDKLETHFDTNNLPDITSNINAIDAVVAKGLGSLIDPSEKAFNDIPEVVQNNSEAMSKDIKNIITKFRSTIEKYRKDTLKLKESIGDSIRTTTDLRKQGLSLSYDDIGDEADAYWLAIIVPFGCITALIPIFQLLGIILGTCGNGDMEKPTKRNSTSNCGGICLMFSVGFMFFFGWLLMILTTVTYIPGSIVERYGCDLVRNIDTNLEKLIDTALPNKKVFGDILPLEINASISDVYSRCKAGESIPEATELNTIINDTIKDFEKQITIKDKIESISVDLSHIEIMSGDVDKWFADMKGGLDINFGNFTSELQKESTQANLTAISSELNRLATTLSQPVLSVLAIEAERIDKNEVKNVTDLKNRLEQDIHLLKAKSQQSLKIYNDLVSAINASEDFLKNRLDSTIKNRLLLFADYLLGIWNNFVSNILRLLNNMLSCKPAVDLFEYLVIGFVCGTVDAFNGFWFGLGCVILTDKEHKEIINMNFLIIEPKL